jgi:outer membrane protein assembly factor BamD
MKYFIPIIFSLLLIGCSASIDTANLDGADRLKYAMELFEDESYDKAIIEFESIILQFPGSEYVDKSQFYLAQSRFKRKEFILAASEFSRLIKTMPASTLVPEAQFMLAECYYQLSPRFSLDQRYTKQSIQEFQAFIEFFPGDKRVADAEVKISELNTKLAEKEFNSAIIYEKLEYYSAATIYYDNILMIYHDTPFAPRASFNKINLLIKREKPSEALKEIENFLLKFPEDRNYNQVQKLKDNLENKLKAALN